MNLALTDFNSLPKLNLGAEHYYNNGPRTNNHLEGYNRKTNNEMPSVNFNIFQYIDFNKRITVLIK